MVDGKKQGARQDTNGTKGQRISPQKGRNHLQSSSYWSTKEVILPLLLDMDISVCFSGIAGQGVNTAGTLLGDFLAKR